MRRSVRRTLAAALTLFLVALVCTPWLSPASAQPPLPGVALRLAAGGFNEPLDVVHAGDGSARLFVVEKPGRVRVLRNEILDQAPFLDIAARVNPAGEGGLLGLAFPPGFAASQRFYVYYVNLAGDIVISQFRTLAPGGAGDPNTEIQLLSVPHPTFDNHYGGGLRFGNDGLLYASTGDGGGGGDPGGNGQNPNSMLGKLLRLDVESQPGQALVPPTNPFAGGGGAPFVWALGLRNPFRFSFDRSTGDLWIGDVGQNVWEEVDVLRAGTPGGRNLGWNVLEGDACFSPDVGCVPPANYLPPVFVYQHLGGRCSVTGGVVYRGADWPRLRGVYVFGDFCTGEIFGMRADAAQPGAQASLLAASGFNPSAFGESETGELYVLRLVSGTSTGELYALETAIGRDAGAPLRPMLLIPAQAPATGP